MGATLWYRFKVYKSLVPLIGRIFCLHLPIPVYFFSFWCEINFHLMHYLSYFFVNLFFIVMERIIIYKTRWCLCLFEVNMVAGLLQSLISKTARRQAHLFWRIHTLFWCHWPNENGSTVYFHTQKSSVSPDEKQYYFLHINFNIFLL